MAVNLLFTIQIISCRRTFPMKFELARPLRIAGGDFGFLELSFRSLLDRLWGLRLLWQFVRMVAGLDGIVGSRRLWGSFAGMTAGCVLFHLSETTTLRREDLQNSSFLEKEKKKGKDKHAVFSGGEGLCLRRMLLHIRLIITRRMKV